MGPRNSSLEPLSESTTLVMRCRFGRVRWWLIIDENRLFLRNGSCWRFVGDQITILPDNAHLTGADRLYKLR